MSENAARSPFSHKLLVWFDQHGRKTLPWQENRDPYRIWVSEIMLQQTQVKAVIPYFERFIHRFPDIDTLAAADSDSVMHHWSGLGYYARARNLHKAAKIIVAEHRSKFPDDFEQVLALPGIGRSTAGAILAFCFGQHQAILDGNVKRVLTRYYGIEGYPGEKKVEKSLWNLAQKLTPVCRVGDYTQAIMDLGATRCTRSRPGCLHCPMAEDCVANQTQTQSRYPFRKPKNTKKQREIAMLIIQRQSGEILLEKRATTGVWGGLWCLPEAEKNADLFAVVEQKFGCEVDNSKSLDVLRHSFTHFDLLAYPHRIQVTEKGLRVMDSEQQLWYNPGKPQSVGLPAIVDKILAKIAD